MTRTAATLAVFLAASPLFAADPAAELEARIQKVIADASPSVVAVVVAHAKYPARFDEKGPGKLGQYEPNLPPSGFRPALTAPPVDPLDLSDPANAADHTFGAGLVLDAKAGLVLVPYHLVDGATKVFVRGPAGRGSYADIRAADARSDLAVLELIDPVPGLRSAKLGTVHLVDGPGGAKVNLRKGAFVVAVGHPLAAGLGDGSPSGSFGVLSNIRRRSAVAPGGSRDEERLRPLHAYGSLLQTDARVALGASGSAVLNLDGEVIGLASAVAAVSGSEVNGGYALPMDVNYRRIIATLAAGKEVEYGFLGVLPGSATAAGVGVSAVTGGCPAADAGVRPGDVIRSVDGNPLTNIDDLHLYVGAALAGSQVTLSVQRGRETRSVPVTLAKNHNTLPFIASVRPPSVAGLRVDYASVRYAQAAWRGNGAALYPVAGVAVRDLDAGSAAEKKFADAGDISRWLVTRVNGKAVATPAEFYAAAAGKASVTLTLSDITAANHTMTVELP